MARRAARETSALRLPILLPFKSNMSTASMLALDAYNRLLFGSMREVFEASSAVPILELTIWLKTFRLSQIPEFVC